jgi:hypothetical protein
MRTRTSRGAALVEFQVATLLVLIPLLLGIVQIALLICGYHVLSYSAAEAARAGAVEHARVAAMLTALSEGLVPLQIDLTRVTGEGGPVDLVLGARTRAVAEVLRYAAIERVTPSREDFADHGRIHSGQRAIPNDALEHRSPAPGRSGGRSLQQANLLRIRVRYCHALVVPLIDRILPALLERLDPTPEHRLCYSARRVPIRVSSSAPMQSEAWP